MNPGAAIPFLPTAEAARLLAGIGDRYARAACLADIARYNAAAMIKCAGSGHLGSSFSSLDIVSWLHLEVLDRTDGRGIYFSSKGHDVPGLYALLVALGRLPEAKLGELRKLGGLPGHPDVSSVPEVAANTGSLGMGISKAKGMIYAARLAGERRQVFVLTGDGELQEGQIWESLAGAVHGRMGELTVLVDHNKLQSDIRVAEVNDLGDLEAKFRAFGWVATRCDGHDFKALEAALERAPGERDLPKVIVCDTVKGRGVSFMERLPAPGGHELYRFHSGAPSDEDFVAMGEEISARIRAAARAAGLEAPRVGSLARRSPIPEQLHPQRLVRAYSEALVKVGEEQKSLVVLDGDLMLDCGVIPFRERFPNRFFEFGIAEQDMVSTAGGMALSGLLPVVHSFACFLTPRANEQIFNNATERRKVIYVGSLAGLLPGGPGHSHQSVRDIGLLAGIPGMTVLEPCRESEVEPLLRWAVEQASGPVYLRMTSVPCDVPPPEAGSAANEPWVPEFGRGRLEADGDGPALLACGPVMVGLARAAHSLALASGSRLPAVYSVPWVSAVDPAWLDGVARHHGAVIAMENHLVRCGFADRVREASAACRASVKAFGLDRIPSCGGNAEVMVAHGFTAEEVLAVARDFEGGER